MTKHILLFGLPNSGKTSLFNALTGANQKVVNYPGATIAINSGTLLKANNITAYDMPGIVSLNPRSEDEQLAKSALLKSEGKLKVFVMDLLQLPRHLALLRQCECAGVFFDAIVITKKDLAEKENINHDLAPLSEHLHNPIFFVNVRQKTTLNAILDWCHTQVPQTSLQSKPQDTLLTEAQIRDAYRWAQSFSERVVKRKAAQSRFELDAFMLHSVMGPLIFLMIMGGFFYSIFALAAPLMEGVDTGVSWLSDALGQALPKTLLSRVLIEGVVAGIGAVLVFVPQLFILFLGLGCLEYSGFLARAAVIIDKPLAKIGLTGRSFVPLLSGCACAIPAMMAARNIPEKWQRHLCIFLIPLMQCSARLPVYGLLLALLFGEKELYSALGLTAIYVGSVVLTGLVSKSVSRFFGGSDQQAGFQIELPRWQRPPILAILKQALFQTKSFIYRAGPTILTVSIFLWVFSVFPTPENAYALQVGRWIEPVFLPMGVDWRVGVALLLSFAAREVFVSALVVIFSIQQISPQMLMSLREATFEGTGQLIFSAPSIIALVVFFMVSMQCVSTTVVAKAETGGWKLPLIQMGGYVFLGYSLAVVLYQVLSRLG